MTPDRLEALLVELRAFVAEREWEHLHDPKNLAMSLAAEVGELLAEYRWVRSEEADALAAGAPNEARARVLAELGDVGISWLLLCDRVGAEPVELVREKLEAVRRKYPVEGSRGRSAPPPSEVRGS